MNRIRLLPIVVLAIGALFALKTLGLLFHGDNPVNPISPAFAQNTDAEAPAEGKMETKDADNAETAAMDKDAGQPSGDGATEASVADPDAKAGETVVADAGNAETSLDPSLKPNAETLILQRLGERRTALEKRSSELDLREQLLNATELRVERRVTELKAIESRIQVAEKKREEKESTRLNGLVQMYENMKPKEAARVFDRLSLDILVEVVKQIKPRKMSAILAKMSPENAERLTVALATDTTTETKMAPKGGDLPKIDGKPTN